MNILSLPGYRPAPVEKSLSCSNMVLFLIIHINEIDRMLLRLYQVLLYLIQPLIWLLLLRSRKAPAYRKRLGTLWLLCR